MKAIMSKWLDIGLGSKESKKVLHDWVIRGLVPQEEAQMLEGQERLLEAQEGLEVQEEQAQVEEAQTEEAQAECVGQMGEGASEKRTRVSSRICEKPTWMADFV